MKHQHQDSHTKTGRFRLVDIYGRETTLCISRHIRVCKKRAKVCDISKSNPKSVGPIAIKKWRTLRRKLFKEVFVKLDDLLRAVLAWTEVPAPCYSASLGSPTHSSETGSSLRRMAYRLAFTTKKAMAGNAGFKLKLGTGNFQFVDWSVYQQISSLIHSHHLLF